MSCLNCRDTRAVTVQIYNFDGFFFFRRVICMYACPNLVAVSIWVKERYMHHVRCEFTPKLHGHW